MKYLFELPALPYEIDALEPFIDSETMYYHHEKHFKTYIDNLNALISKYPSLQSQTLEWLIDNPNKLPVHDREAILFNAGGVYNHNLFFNVLTPNVEETKPSAELMQAINRDFGSFENFKQRFINSALKVNGSGYTFLTLAEDGILHIVNTSNQDVPPFNVFGVPVVLVDVWEHAYYLKYKNLRKEYLTNIFNVLKFP